MKERCRHERHSWLIANAEYEWCYVCGAYRRLEMKSGYLVPISKWVKPSGYKNNNPWEKYSNDNIKRRTK